MTNTMQLFEKALSVKHAAAWARDLNLTRATFSMAKKQGRLSPVLAGNFAMELGEDPEHWVAIAALEAEKDSELLARLKKRSNIWRRLLLANNTKGPHRMAFLLKGRVPWLHNAIHSALDAGLMDSVMVSERFECVLTGQIHAHDTVFQVWRH